MFRSETLFAALIFTQAAHSVEEYVGRLWESFPPARFISTLVSSDAERGFVALNVALVGFGLWCLLFPVRGQWQSARAIMWLWVGIETINGIGHPVWALRERGYAPGLITAPILLALAVSLAVTLLKRR